MILLEAFGTQGELDRVGLSGLTGEFPATLHVVLSTAGQRAHHHVSVVLELLVHAEVFDDAREMTVTGMSDLGTKGVRLPKICLIWGQSDMIRSNHRGCPSPSQVTFG